MKIIQSFQTSPRSAKAFEMAAGQILCIVDVLGGQPGDIVAFNRHDLSESFSQARTRVENLSCNLSIGGLLWSNTQPPRVMFEIMEDTCGSHSLLYTPCCRYALDLRFGVVRDGCLEHLATALAPWGISPPDVPDPLSIFFNVQLAENGAFNIGEHGSEPGDHIALRAEMDCLVAVSMCSVPIEDKPNTGFEITICEE